MDLSHHRSALPPVQWRASTGSTNDDLVELLRDDPGAAEFTTVATDDQTGGRGRLGRSWVAPAGRCLAISTLVRPSETARSWLPLVAGVAVASAVDAELRRTGAPGEVRVKWPNDVRIDGRKVSGILCELTPDGAVVVGTGINVSLREDELPVPTATSLVISGAADADAARILVDYLRELAALVRALHDDTANPDPRERVRELMDTLGAEVRVELPDGSIRTGRATGLESDGRLRVQEGTGATLVVGAGDVTHVRY